MAKQKIEVHHELELALKQQLSTPTPELKELQDFWTTYSLAVYQDQMECGGDSAIDENQASSEDFLPDYARVRRQPLNFREEGEEQEIVHPKANLMRFLDTEDPDEQGTIRAVNTRRIKHFMNSAGYMMVHMGDQTWGSVAHITSTTGEDPWTLEVPLTLEWHSDTRVLDLSLSVTEDRSEELSNIQQDEILVLVENFNQSGRGATASMTPNGIWIFASACFAAGIHDAGLRDSIEGTISRCGSFLRTLSEKLK